MISVRALRLVTLRYRRDVWFEAASTLARLVSQQRCSFTFISFGWVMYVNRQTSERYFC